MNKIIVITGAGGNIGSTLVSSRELRKENTVIPLHSSYCDLTSLSSIKLNIAGILSQYGRIDVLINCAGVMLFNDVVSASDKDMDLSLDVNFKGCVRVIREVLPGMLSQGYGRIINISSIRGITGAPNKAFYSASKFALQGFSDSLRRELTDTNVKITNICPGRVPDSVSLDDIVNTVEYILNLSDKTLVRDIVLGGTI